MNRREFDKKTQVQIIGRAMRGGETPICEGCGSMAKRFNIDHIDPDAMQIDKSKRLTAEDGQLLCIPCHSDKTKKDVANIAKAVRLEQKHLGARPRPKQPIRSENTLRTRVPKDKLPVPPARPMFR